MKKFLLLAGVALATLSANKAIATSYITMNVTANLVETSVEECTPLNFGTIILNQNASGASTVVIQQDWTVKTTGDRIISVNGASPADCGSFSIFGAPTLPFPSSASLSLSGAGGTSDGYGVTVSNFTRVSSSDGHYHIGATLNIPDSAAAGEYTGSFTVTHTY